MKKLAILLVFLVTVSCANVQKMQAVSALEDPTSFVLPQVVATNAPTPTPVIIPPVSLPDDAHLFYMIKRGDTLASVAAKLGITPDQLALFNDPEMIRRFRPDTQLALFDRESILERIYSEPGKKIIVIAAEEKAYAVDGSELAHIPFIISTGVAATPSPIGKFAILEKLKSMAMTGQSAEFPGRKYYIPDVPWDMNFYSVFYLHGAYWHNAFGNPHSGGCINFKVDDAKWVFYWTDPVPTGKITYTSSSRPGTTVWVIP